MGQPIFEENGQDDFNGIDIMRAVRSFDPCLPCGVHMYLGDGKTLQAGPLADVRRAARVGRRPWTIDEARERVARVEALLDDLEALADPAARETALELVQALLELYGEGLARIVAPSQSATTAAGAALAGDELVSHLLLLHGLHPCRSRRACAARSTRSGPTSSRTAATSSWSARGGRRAPAAAGQLQRLPVLDHDAQARDRGRDPQGGARGRARSRPTARRGPSRRRRCCSSRWPGRARDRSAAGDAGAARAVRRRRAAAAGRRRAGAVRSGSAARPTPTGRRCPALRRLARRGRSRATELACPGCGHRYDVRRAGPLRSTSRELHLEPGPLLVDDAGLVRVALAVGGARDAGRRLRLAAALARRRPRAEAGARALRPVRRADPARSTATCSTSTTRELMCACRACSILFDRGAAGGGHYRLVPDRRLRLDGFELDDARVGGPAHPGRHGVLLPQHAGGARGRLLPEPDGRDRVAARARRLGDARGRRTRCCATIEPDVEALLVNRARGARQHWLVPIDDCYELVGLIRTRWRGLTGGKEVWEEIERSSSGLERRGATPSGNADARGAEMARKAGQSPTRPAATRPGIKQGNSKGNYEQQPGHNCRRHVDRRALDRRQRQGPRADRPAHAEPAARRRCQRDHPRARRRPRHASTSRSQGAEALEHPRRARRCASRCASTQRRPRCARDARRAAPDRGAAAAHTTRPRQSGCSSSSGSPSAGARRCGRCPGRG